jgi:hypothetical protein
MTRLLSKRAECYLPNPWRMWRPVGFQIKGLEEGVKGMRWLWRKFGLSVSFYYYPLLFHSLAIPKSLGLFYSEER